MARRIAVMAIAVAVLVLFLALPVPESFLQAKGAFLDDKGRKALACLAFALVLWIGEALPFHITGIGTMLLLGAMGVQPWPDLVRSGMGDEAVIFFVAVLVLAAAIARTGLASRLLQPFLRLSRGTTRGAVFAIMAAGAFLSMWLTALAAAALVLPSARALLDAEGEEPGKSRFGTALAMAVAWGPLIGACASPAGSGSNPVVVRFLAELAHFDISFLQWMVLGVPVALLLLPAGWAILILLFPPERKMLRGFGIEPGAAPVLAPAPAPSSGQTAANSRAAAPGTAGRGALSRDEKAVAVVFGMVTLLWLGTPLIASVLGGKLTVSAVACLGAVALFLPGVTSLRWKDLESSMDWAGILLIASGISLGQALYKSGAAAWVASATLGGIGALPPYWRLAAVVAGVLAVKVVFSSNTLTGTIIVPLIIALGATLGIDARLLALAGGFAANLAVILVTTSPVNVLPWSTGFFTVKDMARAGLCFAPLAAFIVAGVFSVLGGAVGL